MGTQQQTNVLPHAHADLLTDAAYDYYGLRLATCGLDQKIKIWKLDEATGTWSAEDEWKAHDAPIVKLSWAHPEHGSVIASCSFDRTVKIWEERKHEPKASSAVGRWGLRTTLTEARGSVRSVEFAPPYFGLKLATISTDMYLRTYECLEVHNLSSFTVLEELDMSTVSSPLLTGQGTPTLTAASLEPASPSLGPQMHPSSSVTGIVLPAPGGPSPAANPSNVQMTRPGIGAREADGGWCLSWCKEKWWGELIAVGSGTTGVLKIIEFPPNQHPITHLTLTQEPPTAKGARPGKPLAITSVSWAPTCGRSYHLVATGSRDGLVRIWKLRSPKQVGAPGEDGQWIATLVAEFDDHGASVSRVEWNVTGTILSSAGDDGNVRLYKQAYGSVWRSVGRFSTEQADDGDETMGE
ncbi:hypothetical protein FRC01_008359 [Tulasnella sp. 417]|nr:hypothetical protein FRC01_008359 [Tulasnella sp. 417]